jgi:hypothetical protein
MSKRKIYFSTDLVIYGKNLYSTVNYPHYTRIIRHKILITPPTIYIIAGLLISDAWMQKNKSENGGVRLFKKQSIIQSEYLLFSFFLLDHFCSSYPQLKISKLNNKTSHALTFNTRTLECFKDIYNDFYFKGTKIVPHNLYDYLNFQMLAHWIMCDGTRKDNALILQTDCFTIKEVVFILNVLLIKYNIHSTIQFQRNNPVLYIKTASKKRIKNKLIPFKCKSMLYKLGNRRVANSRDPLEYKEIK